MSILVCDIGGTNTRIAQFQAGELTAFEKYPNQSHPDFYTIAALYLDKHNPTIEAVALDLAGPVANGKAQLTNIDWTITSEALAKATKCNNVLIINDLVAMGMSLSRLPDNGLDVIRDGDPRSFDNGQSLVINLGTGFNICPVKETPDLIALAVEAGHASTPSDVLNLLSNHIDGARLSEFDTVEKCFAGRRLSGLYDALWNNGAKNGSEIVSAAESGDEQAQETLRLFQAMLGLYTGSTALNYLPQRGIYFAGSVARGVLGFENAAHFLNALDQDRLFKERIDVMPIKIMSLDEAPLLGCAQAAMQSFELESTS